MSNKPKKTMNIVPVLKVKNDPKRLVPQNAVQKKSGVKRLISPDSQKMVASVVAAKKAEDEAKVKHLRDLAEYMGKEELAKGPVKLVHASSSGNRPAFLKAMPDKPTLGCSELSQPEAYMNELESWVDQAFSTDEPEEGVRFDDLPPTETEVKPVVKPRVEPPTKKPATSKFLRGSEGGGAGSHLLVNALAGTGKTFTVIEGCNRLVGYPTPGVIGSAEQEAIWEQMATGPRPSSITLLAFNKSIATELQKRVPAGVNASTSHSFGLKSIQKAGFKAKIQDQKTNYILCDGWDDDHRRKFPGLLGLANQVCGLIKGNLIDWEFGTWSAEQTWNYLKDKYTIEATEDNQDALVQVLPYLMSEHYHRTHQIDFNDMIWFPNVHAECRVEKSDFVIVDEAQDLNAAQQGMILKAGRRIMLVGDRNQAIYAFAGADEEALDNMQEHLTKSTIGCIELPLFQTRRCCNAVTELARTIVPDFRNMEDAPDGEVLYGIEEDGLAFVGEKDLVVCRTNAPIIVQCLRFLRDGKKARMQGRDIGQDLIKMIEQISGGSDEARSMKTIDLLNKLDAFFEKEAEKISSRKFGQDNAMMVLTDKVESVKAFAYRTQFVYEMVRKIEDIFDDKQTEGTLFSSIHRAKGLEADTVVFFQHDKCPHPMAKSPAAKKQEHNLRYVAITRAKRKLYMIKAAVKKKEEKEIEQ